MSKSVLDGFDPTVSGEEWCNQVWRGEFPMFEIINPETGQHFKIFMDGKIEGFGEGQDRLVRANIARCFFRTYQAIKAGRATQT